MTAHSIYVIDDEKLAREGIALVLNKEYRVKTFASAEAAIDAVKSEPPDLVLLDIGLPGISGIEALVQIKQLYPEMIVIMITAYEDVMTVVSAMKSGAYDYVTKPLQMDALMVNVRNALETITMRKEILQLHERYLKENMPCFIGESNAIQDVMEVVTKVAKSPDTSVLILGETGTGKELIARAIHYRSPNFNGSLICVNCAAIPKELIESELFGYEKGAFSGANASGKAGLVEKAAGGTLFLDEVGDLSMEVQAKFLRFLEEGEYYRVGSTRNRQIKTRVISATNKSLTQMMNDGLFRRDLYYRLAVVKIEVPSLDQRRDDILLIARHFLLEFSRKFGKAFVGISQETEEILKAFDWAGNVRELKNIIEKGVLLGEGPELMINNLALQDKKIEKVPGGPEHESRLPPLTASGMNLSSLIRSIESKYFEEALTLSGGNESKAAQLLQISRDSFRYRRRKH